MPSATGQNWEKYQKTFADDEIEEKKIVPLSEEYVAIYTVEAGVEDGSSVHGWRWC